MTPRLWRAIAGAALAISVVLWPIAHVTGWIHSVVFVNELSLASIVLGCLTWVVASHLDVKRSEEDVAEEVVDRIADDPRLPGGNDAAT